MWYNYPESLVLIIAGFLISLLILFVMQNNYELRQARTVLDQLSKSDSLTGIYNRRYFMDIAEINIEKDHRLKKDCYIVIFNVDGFKSINDTHGHIIGDNVLIEITKRVQAEIRPYDLFARYGGEEFIIYASEINNNGIIEMIERIRLCICDKVFEYEGISLTSSASFGIVCVNDYDLETDILYADKALYDAKKTGRNKTVFHGKNDK